jgi:hypothetical protein
MLEPEEASTALFQLVGRPREELAERFFQLEVGASPGDGEQGVALTWSEVRLDPVVSQLGWSQEAALRFPGR